MEHEKPTTVVIFGASGDLTSRKLVPSLYSLFSKGRLPASCQIVGVARTPFTDEQFRGKLAAAASEFVGKTWQPERWEEFAQLLHYVPTDSAQANGFDALEAFLKRAEGAGGGNRLYYLAVAPNLHGEIVAKLDQKKMNREEGGWNRLIVEKPFGRDLASAQALNRELHAHFQEHQIYRIDHYLGKETVQNLLVFRFANTIFEPVWNHNYIDHVQITVNEAVTVGQRAGYYDQAGVIRDMLQSHLLQVLTLIAMEGPAHFAADPLRNEKVKVLQAIPIPTVAEAGQQLVCGQYEGYRSEKGVAENSRTPTFAALRLQIDNWRWRGVPFYLRSGKGLAARASEVIVQFHCPPHLMFPMPKDTVLQCNRLSLCIQPDEGIHFHFQTKVPDKEGVVLRPADLEFHYRDTYPDVPIPEAYERLLLDALHGDAALFMRSDEIERAWEIMDPFIAASERPDAPPPEFYSVGSANTASADALMDREGRSWVSLCKH